MPYNPKIHHRKSIRLKGYDYSQAGLYFITICVQDRACLFGDVVNGIMMLNDAGKMVEKWYFELENKFPEIRCHEMVVMPNHFHCIIENVGPVPPDGPPVVGADLRVCPYRAWGEHEGSPHPGSPQEGEQPMMGEQVGLGEQVGWGEQVGLGEQPMLGEQVGWGEHVGSPHLGSPHLGSPHLGSPLGRVVQWFKTMTTNEYIRGVKQLGWKPFNGKLWQRNYWENIIRNEHSYQRITQYIINNPKKWDDDKFHGK